MLIPVPKGARCVASASVMKHGRCAACGCEYVYLVECRAEGEGSTFLYGLSAAATDEAREEAQRRAQAALEEQLASRTRDVACPACGRLPAGAVIRGRLLRLLVFLAPAGALAGFQLAGKVSPEMAPIVWMIVGGLVVLGVCVALLYHSRVAPAAEPRDITSLSAALSRGRAVSLSLFDAIMQRGSAGREINTGVSA